MGVLNIPKVIASWQEEIDVLFKYYDYPAAIRESIYTTNWIERMNKELRRRVKTKDSLPNEEAAEKILYIVISSYNEKWSERSLKGFQLTKEELLKMFAQGYRKR